jgi:hypothetical protein
MCVRAHGLARSLWALLAIALLACAPLGAGCNGPGLEPPDGDDGLSNPRGPEGETDAGAPTSGGSGAASGGGGNGGAVPGAGSSGRGGAGGSSADASTPEDGGVDADEDGGALH